MDKLIKELVKYDIEEQAKNSLSHDELLQKLCPKTCEKIKQLKIKQQKNLY